MMSTEKFQKLLLDTSEPFGQGLALAASLLADLEEE
jgi:hypothetical protein